MPNPDWDRQKKEIESYNTFYSAFTGRKSDNSFRHRGYHIRGLFAEIPSTGQDNPKPDFVLYDGETLILVEVKAGDNIEERHIEQMQRAVDLSISDARQYLRDNRVSEETPFDENVDYIEPCIVYGDIDEGYMEEWRGESELFTERLEELSSLVPIMSQKDGSSLRILEGEFADEDIQDWLSRGIPLPLNPQKQFYLTDGLEYESIAVAICQVWGERAVRGSGGVTVSVSDVRETFDYRPPDIADIVDVFLVLEHLDACDEGEIDREYVFKPKHMKQILNIEQLMSDRPFSEYFQEVTSGGSAEEQEDMGRYQDEDDDVDDPNDDSS